MSRRKRYRLYIDESGDHVFEQVNDPRHRYLTLMGVWFEMDEPYHDFAANLRELKERFFGPRPDEPVCLHRRDIIDRRGPFAVLRDEDTAQRFDESLLKLIRETRFCACAVVLDKREHKSKTYRELYHPYHYCLTVLLERYAGWLESFGAEGDVMAESRGRREDKELRRAFRNTYQQGTYYHVAERFQAHLTSKKIKLKRKEHDIPGLQLADLLAVPLKQEIVNDELPRGYGARVLEVVRPKLNCNRRSGKIQGYGQILLT